MSLQNRGLLQLELSATTLKPKGLSTNIKTAPMGSRGRHNGLLLRQKRAYNFFTATCIPRPVGTFILAHTATTYLAPILAHTFCLPPPRPQHLARLRPLYTMARTSSHDPALRPGPPACFVALRRLEGAAGGGLLCLPIKLRRSTKPTGRATTRTTTGRAERICCCCALHKLSRTQPAGVPGSSESHRIREARRFVVLLERRLGRRHERRTVRFLGLGGGGHRSAGWPALGPCDRHLQTHMGSSLGRHF